MNRRVYMVAVLALGVAVARADTPGDETAAAIARRVDGPGTLMLDGGPVDRALLVAVYAPRGWMPLWDDAHAASVTHLVAAASAEGLEPAAYHAPALERTLASSDAEGRAERDLLLTDAVMHYAVDVHAGSVPARRWSAEVELSARPADPVALVLDAALATDTGTFLASLAPQRPEYVALREVLAHYRALKDAGGWPTVPDGGSVKPGASDPVVPVVRKRLAASGEYGGGVTPSPVYDHALVAAVKSFQELHGLPADGVIGRATRAALAVPVEDRIGQVIANLERWRWLPDELGPRYVRVNIAAFALDVVEDGKPVLSMPVVVGRPDRRTPIVSSKITRLIFNPPWTVPRKLAREDMLPKLRRDGGFLAAQGIRVYGGWQAGASEVDSRAIDWRSVGEGGIAGMRLRQEPGPHNPLGRVKFQIPNGFDVYLHDTNHKNLFGQPVRALSSGCVRVKDALALAGRLLDADPAWTADRRDGLTRDWVTRTVPLAEPVPVYILYETVWRGSDGRIEFREDIYGRDASLAKAVATTARRGRVTTGT